MLKVDSRLIQYCKHNDFPIDEMGEDYFKAIESSFGYQRYLLAKSILELHGEIVNLFKEIIIYMIDKIDKIDNILK